MNCISTTRPFAAANKEDNQAFIDQLYTDEELDPAPTFDLSVGARSATSSTSASGNIAAPSALRKGHKGHGGALHQAVDDTDCELTHEQWLQVIEDVDAVHRLVRAGKWNQAGRALDVSATLKANKWCDDVILDESMAAIHDHYHSLCFLYRDVTQTYHHHAPFPHFIGTEPGPQSLMGRTSIFWISRMCAFFDLSSKVYHAAVCFFTRYWEILSYSKMQDAHIPYLFKAPHDEKQSQYEIALITAACFWISRCNFDEVCSAIYFKDFPPTKNQTPQLRNETVERRVMGKIGPVPFSQSDLDRAILHVIDTLKGDTRSLTCYDIVMSTIMQLGCSMRGTARARSATSPSSSISSTSSTFSAASTRAAPLPVTAADSAAGSAVVAVADSDDEKVVHTGQIQRQAAAHDKLTALDTLIKLQDVLVMMSLFQVEKYALHVAVAILEEVVGFDDVFDWSQVALQFQGYPVHFNKEFVQTLDMMRFFVKAVCRELPDRVFAVHTECMYPDIEGGTRITDLFHKHTHVCALHDLVDNCKYTGWMKVLRDNAKCVERDFDFMLILNLNNRLHFHTLR